MSQPLILPLDSSHPDQPGVFLPTPAACVPTQLPENAADSPMASPSLGVRTHASHQMVVPEFSGNLEALRRLTVQDNSLDLPPQRCSRFDQNRRGLSAVAGRSRSFDVLTIDGGKAIWAALNAAQPNRDGPLTARRCHDKEGPIRLLPFGKT